MNIVLVLIAVHGCIVFFVVPMIDAWGCPTSTSTPAPGGTIVVIIVVIIIIVVVFIVPAVVVFVVLVFVFHGLVLAVFRARKLVFRVEFIVVLVIETTTELFGGVIGDLAVPIVVVLRRLRVG